MSNRILMKHNFQEIKDNKNRKYNAIASKIFTINLVLIKCLGYLGSIIILVVGIKSNKFVFGLLQCLGSALTVFIASTFVDGFAEIIQLLEDIKNKKCMEEK